MSSFIIIEYYFMLPTDSKGTKKYLIMDEDRKETYRSPAYSREEVNALVNIIEKHKNVILNKSTTAAASHAKDTAWCSIAKAFNNQGFKHKRSIDSLKIKWDNVKKEARKLTKNVIDIQYCENDQCSRVVTMLLEYEKCDDLSDKNSLETDLNDSKSKDLINIPVMEISNCEDEESDMSDGDISAGRSNRSLNFSPQECSLLMKCVREEKNDIFIKETTSKANQLKSSAWMRIANSFNKRSPRKRSAKVLRTKFTNMKRATKSMNLRQYIFPKHKEKLLDNNEDIKTEPLTDYKFNLDLSEEKTNGEEIDNYIDSDKSNLNVDPLDIIVNGDSGIGISQYNSLCSSDSKDIEKLKIQLLNYQIETAKMERKRLEDAMQAEAAAVESNALERSLRIRAARLEAVAAEAKLSANHPALHYTYEEKRAQHYLESFQNT